MAATGQRKTVSSSFDILLSRNVPHILESIFFFLDYTSFIKCFRVSKKWHTLLNSQIFKKKAKTRFENEILELELVLRQHVVHGNIYMVRYLTSFRMVNLNGTFNLCPFTGCTFDLCPYSGESKCTLLSVAALKGNLEVEHLLLERGAIPDNTYYSTNEKKLWKAANEGNVEEVTRLLSYNGLDKDCIQRFVDAKLLLVEHMKKKAETVPSGEE